MNVFVKKDDVINVEVYAWEVNNGIEAVSEKSEVGNREHQTLHFVFKKPNYSDWKSVLDSAQIGENQGNVALNVTQFQDQVLRRLLKDWDLSDENGNAVSFSLKQLDTLEPKIAAAAAAGVLSKINF